MPGLSCVEAASFQTLCPCSQRHQNCNAPHEQHGSPCARSGTTSFDVISFSAAISAFSVRSEQREVQNALI
eukprot:1473381-Karenia_brevis.AAC.1